MRGSLFYGPKGRLASGVAATAGILAAVIAAAQDANLFSLFPPRFAPYVIAAPILAIFFTALSERIQGGASNPEVRNAAHKADIENELKAINK